MMVLHVTGAYPTEQNPSDGVFICTQVESLAKLGIDVDVCLLSGTGIGRYIKGIAEVRKAVRSREYDIVHAHYMYSGWTARFATILPLVVSFMGNDVYGDCNEWGEYRFSNRVLHGLFSRLLSYATAHNIAKSADLAKYLRVKTTSIISNGVDLDIFYPRTVAKREVGLKEDEQHVLFAGRPSMGGYKRYPLAEAAFELVRKSNPSAQLVTLDKRPQREVARFLNAVDCLLLTSAHEGSPNIVKEALACNLPIVSVDVGDVAERIKELEGCYIVPDEPTLIAEAVAKVLVRGKRLSDGYAALDELSLAKVARRIQSVYGRVLS
ncbi:glycosyltransferase [Bradyrhizobium erythrophlei]|uniref:glycosyltransferase n=1 Tax=Bradyrhizobium erythrophlei TaxID=1437360 RepID=UPI0035EEECB4